MEFIENLELSQKLFLGFAIIIILINIFLWAFNIEINFTSDIQELGRAEIEIQGEVVEKYYDRKNHNYPSIKVKTDDNIYDFYLAHERRKIFDIIKVSDSLFYSWWDLELRIKRNDFDTIISPF